MYHALLIRVPAMALLVALFALQPVTAAKHTATAVMKDVDGNNVGTVQLRETPHGVLLHAELTNLPKGAHAFHIHAVGECEAPFKSAGGHFNPGAKQHGLLNASGKHAGDMPNIHIGANGTLAIGVLASEVTLGEGDNSLFDDDGSAIVIHQGPDDYSTDPAGAAGPRIACGVIAR